jgi:hypothetical protein
VPVKVTCPVWLLNSVKSWGAFWCQSPHSHPGTCPLFSGRNGFWTQGFVLQRRRSPFQATPPVPVSTFKEQLLRSFWDESILQMTQRECVAAISMKTGFLLAGPPAPDHHTEDEMVMTLVHCSSTSCKWTVLWDVLDSKPYLRWMCLVSVCVCILCGLSISRPKKSKIWNAPKLESSRAWIWLHSGKLHSTKKNYVKCWIKLPSGHI